MHVHAVFAMNLLRIGMHAFVQQDPVSDISDILQYPTGIADRFADMHVWMKGRCDLDRGADRVRRQLWPRASDLPTSSIDVLASAACRSACMSPLSVGLGGSIRALSSFLHQVHVGSNLHSPGEIDRVDHAVAPQLERVNIHFSCTTNWDLVFGLSACTQIVTQLIATSKNTREGPLQSWLRWPARIARTTPKLDG